MKYRVFLSSQRTTSASRCCIFILWRPYYHQTPWRTCKSPPASSLQNPLCSCCWAWFGHICPALVSTLLPSPLRGCFCWTDGLSRRAVPRHNHPISLGAKLCGLGLALPQLLLGTGTSGREGEFGCTVCYHFPIKMYNALLAIWWAWIFLADQQALLFPTLLYHLKQKVPLFLSFLETHLGYYSCLKSLHTCGGLPCPFTDCGMWNLSWLGFGCPGWCSQLDKGKKR